MPALPSLFNAYRVIIHVLFTHGGQRPAGLAACYSAPPSAARSPWRPRRPCPDARHSEPAIPKWAGQEASDGPSLMQALLSGGVDLAVRIISRIFHHLSTLDCHLIYFTRNTSISIGSLSECPTPTRKIPGQGPSSDRATRNRRPQILRLWRSGPCSDAGRTTNATAVDRPW